MKKIIFLMVILTNMAYAQNKTYDDSPTKMHSLKNLKDNMLVVSIKYSKNVQTACDVESRKIGNKGFNYKLQACAFWTKDTCTIILPKTANLHTIGHEFLHCLKGDWHPQ